MKKVLVAAVVSVFALGMFSCGHGVCDAYNKSDYTQYKKDHNKKVENYSITFRDTEITLIVEIKKAAIN